MSTELDGQIKELRRQLRIAQENNHKRNVALDALHYVWCNGGCRSGVHRWCEGGGPLTEEVVVAAENNTKRMRQWLENHKNRLARQVE